MAYLCSDATDEIKPGKPLTSRFVGSGTQTGWRAWMWHRPELSSTAVAKASNFNPSWP